MRIYLDDAACDAIRADSVTVAIAAAAELARQRGRTIVDVIVDGRRWNADRIGSKEASIAGTANEIRLCSADPCALACEAFDDAAGVLSEIDRLQQAAAESLQTDRTAAAMDDLAKAIDLWGSVHQAVTMGSSMAEIDLAPHHTTIEQLTAHLRGMKSALQTRDSVALADTLLYDLPEVVSQWRALLHELRERGSNNGRARGGHKA